jgi:hypothetical protein
MTSTNVELGVVGRSGEFRRLSVRYDPLFSLDPCAGSASFCAHTFQDIFSLTHLGSPRRSVTTSRP